MPVYTLVVIFKKKANLGPLVLLVLILCVQKYFGISFERLLNLLRLILAKRCDSYIEI